MKLRKFFIIFFIFAVLFVACRMTNLTTEPKGFPTEYEGLPYVGNYGELVGVYGDGTNYKLVIEGLGHSSDLNTKQKDAIDKIYNIVGKDSIGNVLNALKDIDSNDNEDDILNKLIQSVNLSEEKQKEIKDLIFEGSGEDKKNIFEDFKFEFNSKS